MRIKWRAAAGVSAAIALGAALAAQMSGLSHVIAPPASLPAVERAIARAFADVRQVPPSDLAALRADEDAAVILVDVREEHEYAVSRLEGAVRLDPDASAAAALALIGDRAAGAEIVFYCSVGQRSSAMARRAQGVLENAGARGAGDYLCVRASKPHLAEAGDVGTFLRRQRALDETHAQERTHLGEALQRGVARIGDHSFIAGGGEVALGEAAIVVGRTDDTVEIDFHCAHDLSPTMASSSFTAPGAMRLAIGQAA